MTKAEKIERVETWLDVEAGMLVKEMQRGVPLASLNQRINFAYGVERRLKNGQPI